MVLVAFIFILIIVALSNASPVLDYGFGSIPGSSGSIPVQILNDGYTTGYLDQKRVSHLRSALDLPFEYHPRSFYLADTFHRRSIPALYPFQTYTEGTIYNTVIKRSRSLSGAPSFKSIFKRGSRIPLAKSRYSFRQNSNYKPVNLRRKTSSKPSSRLHRGGYKIGNEYVGSINMPMAEKLGLT